MVRKILYTFGKTANFLLNLCHGFLFVCFLLCCFGCLAFFGLFLFFFFCSVAGSIFLPFYFKLYESAILDTRELVWLFFPILFFFFLQWERCSEVFPWRSYKCWRHQKLKIKSDDLTNWGTCVDKELRSGVALVQACSGLSCLYQSLYFHRERLESWVWLSLWRMATHNPLSIMSMRSVMIFIVMPVS